MNRAERRYRTEKIANKRFLSAYGYGHGTPATWFYYRADKREQRKRYGQCRNERPAFSCRCDRCYGWVQKRKDVADFDFYYQYHDAIDDGYIMKDTGPEKPRAWSIGLFDDGHEMWDIYINPVPRAWSMSDRFHHPK